MKYVWVIRENSVGIGLEIVPHRHLLYCDLTFLLNFILLLAICQSHSENIWLQTELCVVMSLIYYNVRDHVLCLMVRNPTLCNTKQGEDTGMTHQSIIFHQLSGFLHMKIDGHTHSWDQSKVL